MLDDIFHITGINDKRHGYEVIENLIIKYGYPINNEQETFTFNEYKVNSFKNRNVYRGESPYRHR